MMQVTWLPAPVRLHLPLDPPDDHPIFWKLDPPYNPSLSPLSFNQSTKAIRYYLGVPTSSQVNQDEELNTLRSVFDQWEAVPGSRLKFEEAGTTSENLDINLEDGRNLIYWSNDTVFVAGGFYNIRGLAGVNIATFDFGGNIIESDTVLNGFDFKWVNDISKVSRVTFLIEPIALHEVGHMIGLAHSPIGGATMYFQASFDNPSMMGLSQDEFLFMRDIYPEVNTSGNYGSIGGTLTKDGTPVPATRILLEDKMGYMVGATVTEHDGSWTMGGINPGEYTLRYDPLPARFSNPQKTLQLAANIDFRFENLKPTQYLPTFPQDIAITAGQKLTPPQPNLEGTPEFQIAKLRPISEVQGKPYHFSEKAISTLAGRDNIYIGVYSENIPGQVANLRTTHSEIIHHESIIIRDAVLGLDLITTRISIPDSIKPGLLSFVAEINGNQVYANGFLEILDPEEDFNYDGLPDKFQRKHFSPFTASDAGPDKDPDNDGFPNLYEFRSNTDPLDPDSFEFLIKKVEVSSQGTRVTWESIPGRVYRLWSRPEVSSGPWTLVANNFSATGEESAFLDTAQNAQLQFYRVEKLN